MRGLGCGRLPEPLVRRHLGGRPPGGASRPEPPPQPVATPGGRKPQPSGKAALAWWLAQLEPVTPRAD